jgi:hypothetical protein
LAHFSNPLAAHAELPRSSARIGDRQDENLVTFAACAFRTVLGVSNGAFQQRAPQQFAANRQFADQFLARTKGLLANHSSN